jgi:hypothetical protein
MNEVKRFSLVKPSLQTPIHIDFDWWMRYDNNWRVYLYSCLCLEHQELFENLSEQNALDWIDPQTAEVKQVDGIQHTLMSHCAKQPEFLAEITSLVDLVFRSFLANGNMQLTSLELASLTGKDAGLILRTLSGSQVYKGLRLFLQS